MKKIICILLSLLFAATFGSCWKEEIPRAGAPRPQIVDLIAQAGDGTVQLSWSAPQGAEPTDYLVFYTDDMLQVVKHYTRGAAEYTVDGLTNNVQYTFSVQAIYGTLISNPVAVDAKPQANR